MRTTHEEDKITGGLWIHQMSIKNKTPSSFITGISYFPSVTHAQGGCGITMGSVVQQKEKIMPQHFWSNKFKSPFLIHSSKAVTFFEGKCYNGRKSMSHSLVNQSSVVSCIWALQFLAASIFISIAVHKTALHNLRINVLQ